MKRKINHASAPPVLICQVKYLSILDETLFMEWIYKIDAIETTATIDSTVRLNIACKDLYDHDLRELIALLFRYKVNMKQLQIFLNDENKKWFFENKKAYWHKRVFGSNKKSKITQ